MKKVILMLAMLCLVGCKDTPPGPPKIEPPPVKDPRTYTWKVDTISYPTSFQTIMWDIWGSAPNNVYVVGRSDIGRGLMYRYDGTSWRHVPLVTSEGGTIPVGIELFGIHGFSENNIFAVGWRRWQHLPDPTIFDSSLIIHFDGFRWVEVPIQRHPGNLNAVFGVSPTDVWAGGRGLYHFDGSSWRQVNFDTTLFMATLSGTSPSNMYGVAIRRDISPHDSTEYLLFHYNGSAWQSVDSFLITPQNPYWKFGWKLWYSPMRKLYSSAYGVYLKEGDEWIQQFWSEAPLRLHGNSESNIWAVGDFGRIFHSNGSNWRRMIEIEIPVSFRSAWIFRDEAFMIGTDGRQTYILHGK